MSEAISNGKKMTIFIFAFVVYCLVNFLKANNVWGTWNFDMEFTETLKFGLAYLLVDLLGGDVVILIKSIFRFFRAKTGA